jgi:hypothetical protein
MVPHEIRDFGELHRQLIAQFDEGQRERAAAALGLDPCVFDLYPIGFDATLDALAFPAMQATTPRIIGIRYRRILPSTGSSKWTCQPESTAGLLLPSTPPLAREPIFLLEGPSDTLAAAQIGLYAIGRWSCSLDSRQASTLKAHLSGVERPTVIVIGDNDARLTGERGADAAANIVSEVLPEAMVLRAQPPEGIKDIRDWVTAGGACAEDVLDAAKEVRRGS